MNYKKSIKKDLRRMKIFNKFYKKIDKENMNYKKLYKSLLIEFADLLGELEYFKGYYYENIRRDNK